MLYLRICFKDSPGCFAVAGTWISNFNHHSTEEEVEEAFEKLSYAGINTVYFNVWANGVAYFSSSIAESNGKWEN